MIHVAYFKFVPLEVQKGKILLTMNVWCERIHIRQFGKWLVLYAFGTVFVCLESLGSLSWEQSISSSSFFNPYYVISLFGTKYIGLIWCIILDGYELMIWFISWVRQVHERRKKVNRFTPGLGWFICSMWGSIFGLYTKCSIHTAFFGA